MMNLLTTDHFRDMVSHNDDCYVHFLNVAFSNNSHPQGARTRMRQHLTHQTHNTITQQNLERNNYETTKVFDPSSNHQRWELASGESRVCAYSYAQTGAAGAAKPVRI